MVRSHEASRDGAFNGYLMLLVLLAAIALSVWAGQHGLARPTGRPTTRTSRFVGKLAAVGSSSP